jgi:hypothetical protein
MQTKVKVWWHLSVSRGIISIVARVLSLICQGEKYV